MTEVYKEDVIDILEDTKIDKVIEIKIGPEELKNGIVVKYLDKSGKISYSRKEITENK